MKKILLLLVTIFMIQFNSYGQSTQCEPAMFPDLYECYEQELCSLNVSLGDCGSITVYFLYKLCFNLISQHWVCTFKIETLNGLPEDCYIEYLGIEYEMFDIIMESILLNSSCAEPCRPHGPGGCGWYDDFYLASCWHWASDPSPEPGDYMLEPCLDKGCCRVMWQVCIINNVPTAIKLTELPEIPCRPDPENGCHVIICGEL